MKEPASMPLSNGSRAPERGESHGYAPTVSTTLETRWRVMWYLQSVLWKLEDTPLRVCCAKIAFCSYKSNRADRPLLLEGKRVFRLQNPKPTHCQRPECPSDEPVRWLRVFFRDPNFLWLCLSCTRAEAKKNPAFVYGNEFCGKACTKVYKSLGQLVCEACLKSAKDKGYARGSLGGKRGVILCQCGSMLVSQCFGSE